MSSENYISSHYGIAIPLDGSEQYDYIIKKLASKYKNLYKDGYDEEDFLYELKRQYNQTFDLAYESEGSQIITLNGNFKHLYNNSLILAGKHTLPNIYSAPFKSKDEAINHYKQQFGDILPKDFDYENKIGQISYINWY